MASQKSGSPRAAARRRQNATTNSTVHSSRSKSPRTVSTPAPQILQALSAVADGVLVLRRNGTILHADAGACSLLNSTKKRVVGSAVTSLIPPDTQKEFRAAWKRLRADGTMTVVIRGAECCVTLHCYTDPSTQLFIGTMRDTSEQQRTVNALTETEHRYRMFIDNSSEGIWCFGLKRPMAVGLSVKEQISWFFRYGYLMECNDAYAAMYGFTKAEEIVGIMLKDVMDRKDPKNIAYLTAFVTSGYKLRETETNEQDRHGRTFTVMNNLTGTVVDGRLINAWGTQRDVTEKNLQELALKQSKEAHEDLVQRLPFVVYRWRRTADGQRFIEYVSPQVKELCGISAEELIAHQDRFVSMIHPDDRSVFLNRNMDSSTTLEPFQHECRAALVGSERWLRFESTPRKLENGDILWNGLLRDVTERVLAHRALGISEERHRNLVNNLNEGIWVIDANAVTTMVNPRMTEMVGVPAATMAGRSLFDFIRKEDFQRTSNALKRREDGVRETREYTFIRPDGSRIHTTIETYPLTDPDGAYVGAVAAFTDVTEQRLAADRIRRESEQHRFLAEASGRLAQCSADTEVYALISDMLTSHVPNLVVFVLKTSEDAATSTLMEIGGIDDSIIAKGAKILRYEPRGKVFQNKPEFVDQFCKPNLRKFSGGLYEASAGYVPKFVARGIEKLLGVNYYYSIGISSVDDYFGYLNIMSKGPLTVEEATIEAFVHQCFLALTKFRSARRFEEEASRRRFFFEHASDGIGVLDKERRLIEVNRRFAEMHGYTIEEMLGLFSWDISAIHTTKRAMEQLVPGLPDVNTIIETRHRRKDGSVFDVELSFNLAIWNDEPQIYCVCRDVTERKRAAALFEQEALRRKTMMDILIDGVMVLDQEHRVVECNPSICTMLGYSAEELKRLHTWNFDAVMTEERIRKEFSDLRTVSGILETVHRRKDGSTFEVEVSANGTMIDGNNFVIAVCRDITERKRMEIALRTSEAQYRMLVNRIPQRVFVKDVRSNYVSCNESYAADLGLPAHAIIGRNDLEFFPHDLAEQYRADDRWVAENKMPIEREEPYVLGGEHHTILTTKVPLFDDVGTVTGILGIFGDITDRKRMENALRASEERFRAYLEHSPAIITIVDRTGIISYINRVEGPFTTEDFVGKNIFATILPEHHAVVRQCLEDAVQTRTVRSYTTSANVNSETWWYDNRVAVLNADGTELLITAVNITEQKNAEQALRKSEEILQNIFETLEEGVALNELVYDAQGTIVDHRILEVNRAFEHIAQLPREQVVGRLATDIYQMPVEYITAFWKQHINDTAAVKTDLYNDQIKSWQHVSTSIPKNGRFVTSFFDITEMKKAEEALRTSEQYNRSLLDTSPNALAVTDLNGRIVDVNARALQLFGFDPKEPVVGMDIMDRVSPSHRSAAGEQFAELRGGTLIQQLVLPMLRKDGSSFIGELNGALVCDANGTPTLCIVVTSDITKRVHAEEELRMTNAQLQSLINSQTNFVVRTDMNGRYTFVNDQFCRSFGYLREEILGSDARNTYLMVDHDKIDKIVTLCVMNPGTAYTVTIRKRHPVHGIAQTEWEFIAITDENGMPTEIQCVGHDVTEKLRAAEQLRISEERYRTVANFTYDWEMWIDANDTIQYISPSCERVCGYTPDEITDDPGLLTAMVHPDDRSISADHRTNEFHGDLPHSLEYRIIHRSGEERWINHICRPIATDDGRKLGRRISNRDVTERKLHEQQIRWSEQRYRNIVENIHQAYYEADRYAIFTYCNPGLLILSGYSEEELIGRNSFRLIHPEDRESVKSEYRKWRDTRQRKMSVEFRVLLKNGSSMWVEQTTHFEFDEQGRFKKAINFAKDISERKSAEQQLFASELRYRQITEAITDYIYTVTVEGSMVTSTKHGPGCQAVTGYSMEEFDHNRYLWSTMIVPEDQGLVEERIRAVLENKASQPVEHRIIRKDGALRWVRNTLVPRYNDAGTLTSYDGLIQDITERKTAEEGLRHSEAWNRALVRTIPDVMFVQDSDGRFLDVHIPETSELLLPSELFIGRTLNDLVPFVGSIAKQPFAVQSPDIPETMKNADDLRGFVEGIINPKLRQAVKTGMMQEYQYSIIVGDRMEYYEARLIAFDDDKILHIIRNVTEKMVYENTLRMMNEELEERVARRTRQLTEANHELEAFSYSVSHDLRAPLRAIDSFSAMLVEGYADRFDDEGRRLVSVVRTSIKKMDQLINGLLTLSRIGRNELHTGRIEMGALIRELLQENLSDEQRSRYSVIVGKLPACRADVSLVRQAAANLIMNAVKYSSTVDAPVIIISGQADGEFIRYTVKDNGVGFDPSNANKLFGIFQRLHTEDQFKGLGIGLSIVQRIVHRHGGRVSAEGQLNAGASFSFTLPAADPADTMEAGA